MQLCEYTPIQESVPNSDTQTLMPIVFVQTTWAQAQECRPYDTCAWRRHKLEVIFIPERCISGCNKHDRVYAPAWWIPTTCEGHVIWWHCLYLMLQHLWMSYHPTYPFWPRAYSLCKLGWCTKGCGPLWDAASVLCICTKTWVGKNVNKKIVYRTWRWTGSQRSPPGSMWSFNTLRAMSLLDTLSVVNHPDYKQSASIQDEKKEYLPFEKSHTHSEC